MKNEFLGKDYTVLKMLGASLLGPAVLFIGIWEGYNRVYESGQSSIREKLIYSIPIVEQDIRKKEKGLSSEEQRKYLGTRNDLVNRLIHMIYEDNNHLEAEE